MTRVLVHPNWSANEHLQGIHDRLIGHPLGYRLQADLGPGTFNLMVVEDLDGSDALVSGYEGLPHELDSRWDEVPVSAVSLDEDLRFAAAIRDGVYSEDLSIHGDRQSLFLNTCVKTSPDRRRQSIRLIMWIVDPPMAAGEIDTRPLGPVYQALLEWRHELLAGHKSFRARRY